MAAVFFSCTNRILLQLVTCLILMGYSNILSPAVLTTNAKMKGYFKCTPQPPRRDKCNLTCEDGFYSSPSDETVCEETVDSNGNWNFECSDRNCPKDCSQLLQEGVSVSGVYPIQPGTYPEQFNVYCDMETDGGGWTVFQRRLNGCVEFYRGWEEYKEGFGNINSEYWLGNEKLFYLTSQGDYVLRVDLKDFEGETRYALYKNFRIGDETRFYKLMIGDYSGNAGDSLDDHNDKGFTTKDADHDMFNGNCAVKYKGAWWYYACHKSNLNGIYLGRKHESYADGVNWYTWHGFNYSLKATEMKIRRVTQEIVGP